MEIVTYLLGAGASAQCLPVVKDLSKRIRVISQQLKTDNSNYKFRGQINLGKMPISQSTIIRNICTDLDWMAEECDKHSSIDTFAKKLFILNDTPNYIRLKTILSIYFTLEQKITSPDLRYDNFWASILEEKNKFPSNLRLVSWNYDFQLEQSYLNFSDSKTLLESYSNLGIRSFWDTKRSTDSQSFSVYKLNGSATISDREGSSDYYSNDFNNNDKFYEDLIYKYGLLSEFPGYQRNLSFAWEHNLNDTYFHELKLSIKNTQTLVVIGYSFPYFNRKIDRYLIDCMPFLERIYFQAPDANNLKERFTAINNTMKENNLIQRVDLEQFTFPNEL